MCPEHYQFKNSVVNGFFKNRMTITDINTEFISIRNQQCLCINGRTKLIQVIEKSTSTNFLKTANVKNFVVTNNPQKQISNYS